MTGPMDHGADRSARAGSACDAVRGGLVDFDRDELGAAEAAAVRSHLASCAPCAAELRRLRRAVALVARATDIAPTPAGSARLRRTLDAALAESAATPAPSQGRLIGLWERARARYEESAAFRRFTIASIGVHAAAAILLAVVLARSAGTPDRPAVLHVQAPETAFTLPDHASDVPDPRTAALGPFDAATADGVALPGTPGDVYPNATTAARWGATATPATRRAALRVSLGERAQAAEASIERGLAWISGQRAADGSLGAPAESVVATSASVLAFAGEGRTTADDAGLGLSVAWLERNAERADVEDRALALRALTAQLVADYGRIDRQERVRRASAVASMAERLGADAARRASSPSRDRLPPRASVAVVAALADVRSAGLGDTAEALGALVRRLDFMRSPDGHVTGRGADEGVALTAALAEVARDAGARPLSEQVVGSLSARICTLAASSTRDAARGAGALAALGRPVHEPVLAAVASQRADGSWAPAAGTRPPVSAIVESAYGVVAVTRAYRR